MPGFPSRQLRSPDVHQDGVCTDLRRVWNQAAHHVLPRAWSLISSWMLSPTAFPNPRVTHTASGSLMCSRPSPAVASPMVVPALFASATTSTPIRGTVWPAGDHHCVIFDAGAHAQCVGQPGKAGNDRLGQPACRGDFKIILPGQRFHRRMEGACRSIARQIDGNDGGIAQRHGKEDHESTSGLAEQRP